MALDAAASAPPKKPAVESSASRLLTTEEEDELLALALHLTTLLLLLGRECCKVLGVTDVDRALRTIVSDCFVFFFNSCSNGRCFSFGKERTASGRVGETKRARGRTLLVFVNLPRLRSKASEQRKPRKDLFAIAVC
mmetsp:Transcript_756/g.1928  ORF Transcript_756/g.1928 Transcript_756/m.1928 type:complete len:137 (+) Transcript_756:427-837(+)